MGNANTSDKLVMLIIVYVKQMCFFIHKKKPYVNLLNNTRTFVVRFYNVQQKTKLFTTVPAGLDKTTVSFNNYSMN